MKELFEELEHALSNRGWSVQKSHGPVRVPQVCRERYAWLPDDVLAFLCGFETIISPCKRAWLTTHAELTGDSDSAFAWNQWEHDSLSAAEGDTSWQGSIRAFWDAHFPVLLSVKSGYAYVAIRKDLFVVAGEEPEYEETSRIADNFSVFLRLLSEGNEILDRWV